MTAPPLIRYGTALVLVAVALLPWLHGETPALLAGALLLPLAVTVVGWYGGRSPALLASAVAIVGGAAVLPGQSDEVRAAVAAELLLLVPFSLAASTLARALQEAQQEALEANGTLEERDILARALTDHLDRGIMAFDGEGRLMYANPTAERLLGYERGDLKGKTPDDLWRSGDGADEVRVKGSQTGASVDDAIMRRRDDSAFAAEIVVAPIPYRRAPPGSVVVFDDLTERRRADEAFRHQALHDVLTGLPNRDLLVDRLNQAIVAAAREGESVALLLMDIFRLTEVNETFGHHYGDRLLQLVGARIEVALRQSDSVARVAGDEFAVILPGVGENGTGVAIGKALNSLIEPFDVDDQHIQIGVRAGLVLAPEHGTDGDLVLRRAEVALMAAKRTGVTPFTYNDELEEPVSQRLELARDLRTALMSGGLSLHYQPIVELSRRRIVAVEALARWDHPRLGPIDAARFVPLADRMGLVHSFTSWMLREALEQRERWAAAGMPVQLHVNLFQRDWRDEKLMTLLDEAAGTYRPSQGWLTLEIPQAHLTGDPEVIVGHLENLRRRGVSLLVDQVGTADSSLALLSRLPITGLKVDAAFVRRPVDRRKSVAIFHILVELAHRLGLAAFVEGIEEEEEVSAAREIGCDAAQGFFFSPPIPAFAIPEKIASIADRPVH